jgi:hypothetical protein
MEFNSWRRIRSRAGQLAATSAALALVGFDAGAQAYVRPDCRPLLAAPRLDPSPPTARWYRRFWTGECGGLSGCMGGSPNWNEIVGKLVARSAPGERPTVLAKTCRLGPLIGQEWTRPRDVRRIDSGDLRGFERVLESAGDVLKGIDQVEAQARAKVGRRRG